jgi:glycosyltransferase involved in cell wall biosynthesis
MDRPKVSVVIPVWNGERYLQEAVESVRNQDLEGLEIVVVDDGSTDGTSAILRGYAHDGRIRVHSQTNQGLVAALNIGIQIARADYIARFDSDDICMPRRLETQLRYLESHPSVLALGGAIEMIDEHGHSKGRRNYPLGQDRATNGMLAGCTLAHPAVMMRKAAVLAVGGYRSCFKHAEDYDLWLRLIDKGSVDNLDEVVIKYRVHPESVTQKHGSSQSLSATAARIAQLRRAKGLPDPFASRVAPLKVEEFMGASFSDEEQAAFAHIRFRLLAETGASVGDYQNALSWVWSRRRYIPRGRLVRHCLVPAITELRKAGRSVEAMSWFTRAFLTEPLSACWSLIR